MKIFRITMAIIGWILAFGAAGADQMYTDWGQTPPESVNVIFVIGVILILSTLIIKRER